MLEIDELTANASEDFKAVNPELFGQVSPTARMPALGAVAGLGRAGGANASDSITGAKSIGLWKAFEAEVIKWLQDNDFRVAHFRPAKTEKGWRTAVSADGAGFPDILAVKGKYAITLEIKTGAGKAPPEQVEWLLALDRTGIRAYLVTPENWNRVKAKLEILRTEKEVQQ